MAAGPIIRTCSLALAALLAAGPALAQPQSPADIAAYVRARAADADGAADVAAAGYAEALARAPNDEVVAIRAYRQGLAAGDYMLAGRAAAVLSKSGVAPPDVALFEFAQALKAGDRIATDRALVRLADGPLDFLAPVLGAWVAFDRGEDSEPLLETARRNSLARRYASSHGALLLIAGRRPGEGLAQLAGLLGPAGADEDLRIDAAQLLAATGARDEARALLAGPRPQFAALRKKLGRGVRPGAAFGASRLMLALAVELAEEDTLPLSILLTRAALLLDAREDRARLYLAEALSRGGSDALALRVLGEIPADSPFARGAVAGRVAALSRAGRMDEALAQARALAEARDGTSADGQLYGDLLAAVNRHGAAADAYGAALARFGGGDNWSLHLRQGTALDHAGRWDEALSALRRAAELAPEEPSVLTTLGTAQVARGENLAEAQALLERAVRLRPDDAGIADSLAWAYFRRGDVTRALPLLERAAQADPGASLVNEHLGDAYWQLGRRYEARYAWNAASLHAENEAAKRISDKLAYGLKGAAAQ